ncbi:MAG: hypothetical protein COY58_07735 [Gammaproteobacteria bacterium CG_4_10_14_0_8_um_filter_38_16]|nr:MAG: hypothetical protein COY58_07735 [Gammaproteobacteria bacterium CG_4_10_14_0_8_um_filter_38_16]PJA03442.1 MAG: hypothetical protein COX72_04985 [Gammaproteobacteria bacterium CG_4_10_14_0_2_um_filter_38_22]PJB10597.1 MAG: hypothetical protein CO120_03875 [Gammaproteobacteria bacterium CG_4_9_14_3_um_filter_38_9]
MFIKGTSGVSSHPKLHTYQEGYLLPVLSADELLFSARHKGLLRQFRDLAELPQDDFDRSYGELIKNFMEFAQLLPHKSNGILGSLLNYGLARTAAVFQKYCQLRKNQTTPLLKFAVFSAALLKDLGRVMSNQCITLTDQDGEFIRDWNPLSGSMINQTDYYKMYPIAASYLRIEAEVTPLLARQLIPNDIFLWLSSDVVVFSDWLAALLGQEGVGSKEITWILGIIKREDIIAVLNTLDGALVEETVPVATEEGDRFYRWLKEGIEKGDIAVNTDNAGVHVVNEGILIEKKIFKQFADISKSPVNFAVVFAQFGNAMGIAKKGGSDFLHAQYFSAESVAYGTFSGGAQKARSSHEGMVVAAEKVFIHKAIPETSSLKTHKAMINEQHQSPANYNAIVSGNHLNKNK